MKRKTTGGLAVLVLGTVAGTLVVGTSDPPSDDCRARSWGPLTELASLPAGSSPTAPLAVRAGDSFILGGRITENDSTLAGSIALWRLSDGESLGGPAGDFLFLAPELAADQSGRPVLFWLEPASPAVVEEELEDARLHDLHPNVAFGSIARRPSHLWFATFYPRLGWGDAVRATAADGSTISVRESISALIRERVHIASALSMHVVHYEAEATEWREPTLAPVPASGSPVLLATEAGIELFYVGHPANAIYRQTLAGGGEAWSAPTIPTDARHAGEVWPIRGAGEADPIHVVWPENQIIGAPTERLRVAVLDGERPADDGSSLDAEGSIRAVRVGTDECGVVHVVYSTVTYHETWDELRLWHARWQGEWLSNDQLFANVQVEQFEFVMPPGGDGVLVLHPLYDDPTDHTYYTAALSN